MKNNEWKINKYSENSLSKNFEIIHCQTKKIHRRLSKEGKEYGLFISDETTLIKDNLNEVEKTHCPNCQEKIPDYILFQFELLTS